MNDIGATFFDVEGDKRMEEQNQPAWDALIQHIQAASQFLTKRGWSVLDWGCHTGGLLQKMSQQLSHEIEHITGVEPLDKARKQACTRLPEAVFWPTLADVPTQSIDVLVSHEVLYLIELDKFLSELKRILRPKGGAFIALGSHGENSAWMRWRNVLRDQYGHISYVHQPMDILKHGNEAGFDMETTQLWSNKHLEPLRYSPPEDGWGEFKSVREMLEFRHNKLLFIFYPRQA